MKRIDTVNARPDANGVGKLGFHDNSDVSGQDATYLSPEWCNHVQEEIANVIEGFGIELDGENKAQLLEAIQSAINNIANDKYDKTGGEIDGDVSITGQTYLHTLWIKSTENDSNVAAFVDSSTNEIWLISNPISGAGNFNFNKSIKTIGAVQAGALAIKGQFDEEITQILHYDDRTKFVTDKDFYEFDKPIHAPSFIGGNVSIAENGYTSLPNGLIMQWGVVADDGLTKNFPITFPNQCFVLTASILYDDWYNGSNGNMYHIVNNGQFRLRNGGAASYSDNAFNSFIAIGY